MRGFSLYINYETHFNQIGQLISKNDMKFNKVSKTFMLLEFLSNLIKISKQIFKLVYELKKINNLKNFNRLQAFILLTFK